MKRSNADANWKWGEKLSRYERSEKDVWKRLPKQGDECRELNAYLVKIESGRRWWCPSIACLSLQVTRKPVQLPAGAQPRTDDAGGLTHFSKATGDIELDISRDEQGGR